jgi:hypothetical protein
MCRLLQRQRYSCKFISRGIGSWVVKFLTWNVSMPTWHGRVTRLGEYSPMGVSLAFGRVSKTIEVAFLGRFFPQFG